MLKFEGELILLVDEVVDLGEDASPFPVGTWQHSKHRLQPLTIKLCLIVQILEGERQLLSLGCTFDREVKPGLVAIFLVRSTIMRHPEPIFVLLSAFANSS